MGQTVNLLALPSVVRIHLHPHICGSSSVDRALAFQAEGRGFEPRLPLSKEESNWVPLFFYPLPSLYLHALGIKRDHEQILGLCINFA